MKRVPLPDGQWVDIREPNEVLTKHRRMIRAIAFGLKDVLTRDGIKVDTPLDELNLTEEQADAFFRMQEISIGAILMGWSYPEPVPTVETVGDMPGDRFEMVAQAVAEVGADIAAATLNTDASGDPDDGSPSGGSEH